MRTMKRKRRAFTLVEFVTIVIIPGVLAVILIPHFQNASKQRQETTNAATMPTTREVQTSVVTAAEFAKICMPLKKPNSVLLGLGEVELAGGTYTLFLVRDSGSSGSETLYFLTEGEVRKLQN